MWYIYTMEYYSAIKRNKIMPLGATWMDQEILILSGQTQRQIYHLYVEFLKKGYNELIHKTEEEPWI